MSIVSAEELIESIRKLAGENVSDEVITLIENVSDTVKNAETSGETWKEKYDALDAEWRRKYIERFSSGQPSGNEKEEEKETEKITFADLFE